MQQRNLQLLVHECLGSSMSDSSSSTTSSSSRDSKFDKLPALLAIQGVRFRPCARHLRPLRCGWWGPVLYLIFHVIVCYGAQLGQAAVSGCTLPFSMALVVCPSLLVLEQPAVPSLGFQLVANHCALSYKLTGPAVLGAAHLFLIPCLPVCISPVLFVMVVLVGSTPACAHTMQNTRQ
jgi:hypothetical protein